MPHTHHAWKQLASELIVDTPHLRLRRDRIETPQGHVVEDYHVRETAGFSVIFALTEADEVVIVRQYKYGIGEVVTELPGGAIDPGESAVDAARRELAEETGFEVDSLELVRRYVTDPTNSNGRYSLFFGTGARRTGAPKFDPTEDIAVELVPLDALAALVREGSIDVGFHVASIYAILDRLGRLQPPA